MSAPELALFVVLGAALSLILVRVANRLGYEAGLSEGNRRADDATRAAATVTRATLLDELSKLEPLKCGRGPGHFRASDVRRIVSGEYDRATGARKNLPPCTTPPLTR